ncbi:hypothetical protein BDN71DRAFT_1392095 [Pleurotus eryngii]|uniref:Uncharacterized protein n=1 Tax=Pleurotus eryngii TaxID=5323 RepID=A0A9P5ZXW6_PLEER|nr:hypothetical protein BDN71DRAFT_1392095 [Pleurotus eryngii]
MQNQLLDKTTQHPDGIFKGFKTTNISISVPSGDKNVPPAEYAVPGLQYWSLLSVLKSAFTHPLAAKYHLSLFKLFHLKAGTEVHKHVYGELYNLDEFIQEHNHIQCAPLPPQEQNCKHKKVVAALMYWSDLTHLANFRTAKLWPIYMLLGNLSKYICTQPTSGACHHVAYIPSVCEYF